MENEPQHDDTEILHFVIRGLGYSLHQNVLPRDEVVRKLRQWYPDVDIRPNLRELDENDT